MWVRDLSSFISRHHGLIPIWVANDAGVSRSSWFRAITRGDVERVSPSVVRVWGAPETWEHRTLAAVWTAGRGSVASHRTAAALWGLRRRDDSVIDVIPASRSPHRLPYGAIEHRQRDRIGLVPVELNSIPTTRLHRTILDLGAVDPRSVVDAVAQAVINGLARPDELDQTVARHSRQGRNGIVALRSAVETWEASSIPADSVLEARMATVLADSGLPTAIFHARIAGFEVDFLLAGTTVVIECDGWASHGLDRDQFEFDRQRDGHILAAGFVTVHVTWRELMRQPQVVVRRIRAVLAAH